MCENTIKVGNFKRQCQVDEPNGHEGDCVYALEGLELLYVGKAAVLVVWRG